MKHTKHICPACNATLSLGEDGKLRRRIVLQAEFKFDPFDKSPVDEHITARQHANAARDERSLRRSADLVNEQRKIPPSALAYEPRERVTTDERLDTVDRELSRGEERHGLLPVLIVMALGAAATAYVGWVLWKIVH